MSQKKCRDIWSMDKNWIDIEMTMDVHPKFVTSRFHDFSDDFNLDKIQSVSGTISEVRY